MGDIEYKSDLAFKLIIPGCLPVLEDGVGCPDPITFCGDLYENMFLWGVVGVIEAGGRDERDGCPGGVRRRPNKSSGEFDRKSCGTESPINSLRNTLEYVLLASSVRWKCNSP